MKKFTVSAVFLTSLCLLSILLVHRVTATVNDLPPVGTDIYTSRAMENGRPSGVINTSHLSIFGPHICTAYGDPFSPFNSIWAPGSYTYHYRIFIPSDYPSDTLRIEIFDPDSINRAENTHAVSFSATANALDPITFPLTPVNKICSNTDQKSPCLIDTGELTLVDPNGGPPVTIDQINPYWFARVDENRGQGSPPGNGLCGSPSSYTPAYNTATLYELYYYVQNLDGTFSKIPLASYTGQTGDGVRDNGDHQTDMHWVSPGGTTLYDQPVPVPADPGSANNFELSLGQDLPGIVTDPLSGDRFVYLDITTLSGASENSYDIWAGPLYPGISSNVNVRNIQVLNDPTSHHPQGVVVTALGDILLNSNVAFPTDIPLTRLAADQAGQSVYLSLFDSDAGAQPPIVFHLDTIAEADWSLTFAAGDPDPDGVSGRCLPGSCNDYWVSPAYEIQIPTLNGDCDLANPDPQICTPFYGGNLVARYIGGEADTAAWQVTTPIGEPDPSAGCTAFPITINQDVRSVTPPGIGANPYPDANDFQYPLSPPNYTDFIDHVADVPLTSADEGTIYKVAPGTDPGDFSFLVWNTLFSPSNATLANSLAWPGDSQDYNTVPIRGYQEPGDPTDRAMNIGDWVADYTGVVNSYALLDTLNGHIDLGRVLRFPIWDIMQGSGSDLNFNISGFALFKIQGYNFTQGGGGPWLLLEFIGWDHSCGQTSNGSSIPPGGVSIEGPATGIFQNMYTFTTTVGPLATTLPITYTWEATGQETIIQTGGGLTSTISFSWPFTGTQTISVLANNGIGLPVGTTHMIVIESIWHYLPAIMKE